MADRSISSLTALTAPASGDYLPIIDISEASATDRNKRISIQNLFQGIPVNVGIGTGSPTEALSVDGNIALTTSPQATITVGTAAEEGPHMVNVIGGGATNFGYYLNGTRRLFSSTTDTAITSIACNAGSAITFFNGTSEVARLDSSGRVGIGTSSPGAPLHVIGTEGVRVESTTTSDGFIRFVNTSGSMSVGMSGAADNIYQITDRTNAHVAYQYRGGVSGFHLFSTNNTERARIDSSGRLLVGTSTTPTGSVTQYAKFFLVGNTGDSTASSVLALGKGSAASNGDTLGQIYFTDSTNGQYAFIGAYADAATGSGDNPGRLVFATSADGASSPTERMRIDSNGSWFLGNTGTSSPSKGFDAYIGFDEADASAMAIGHANGSSSGTRYFSFCYNSTQIGSISQNGTTAVAYNTSSDYRLKENVVPLTGAIDRVNQLQVHRFNFIADPDRTVDGFIAHEAQEVVPECVTGTKDEVDADGNPVYQGIDQSKLVPLLAAALKEAITKIESLEAKVAALEGA